MSDTITRQDLDALGDRIEKRFDTRFDRFEAHFDETMTSIRATLDDLHEQVSAERHREMRRLEGALLDLAQRTGHYDDVAKRLHEQVGQA